MTLPAAPDIVCIGAVLWDIIGRAPVTMGLGADVPGKITRVPGGVALNVAMTLRRFGFAPTLLTAVGENAAGEELLAECAQRGVGTEHIYRATGFANDRYLAIEDSGGLVAAIADFRTLEAAGAKILLPLADGRLGSMARPWAGPIVLDGNLTEALLAEIAGSPLFAAADLRVVSASTGKVGRLWPLLAHPRLTLYLNRDEASLLCAEAFPNSAAAAAGLRARGARRVLVTDGGRDSSDSRAGEEIITLAPPPTTVNRVTGAGDTFLAAHIAAERGGVGRGEALSTALRAASEYVAGEIGS